MMLDVEQILNNAVRSLEADRTLPIDEMVNMMLAGIDPEAFEENN